jgi:hypothetical protein
MTHPTPQANPLPRIGFLEIVGSTRVFVPGVAEALGHGLIATENALAALSMAFYPRVGQRHLDDAPMEHS